MHTSSTCPCRDLTFEGASFLCFPLDVFGRGFPLHRRQISSDITCSSLSSTATKTKACKGLAWRLNKSPCNSANARISGTLTVWDPSRPMLDRLGSFFGVGWVELDSVGMVWVVVVFAVNKCRKRWTQYWMHITAVPSHGHYYCVNTSTDPGVV